MKGAFYGCPWCNGSGCLQCPAERKKAEELASRPLFTARRDNARDMERLRNIVGAESLAHAFGPDGGGMQEIREKAALQSILQALDQEREKHA